MKKILFVSIAVLLVTNAIKIKDKLESNDIDDGTKRLYGKFVSSHHRNFRSQAEYNNRVK